MLFHVTWQFTDQSEEGERRVLNVLEQWQPPEGVDFQGFYIFADNSGGVAIIEVDSAATLSRFTAPWVPWLVCTVTPIVPVAENAAIAAEGVAFRDSVA